jgi:hypothetical protein
MRTAAALAAVQSGPHTLRSIPTLLFRYSSLMAWRIDKQANGKFAIYSSRIDDYIVIDADEAEIERIYKEKGIKVYLASARAQMTTRVHLVPAEGEAQIAASRVRGTPSEGSVPIGVTGFTLDDE